MAHAVVATGTEAPPNPEVVLGVRSGSVEAHRSSPAIDNPQPGADKLAVKLMGRQPPTLGIGSGRVLWGPVPAILKHGEDDRARVAPPRDNDTSACRRSDGAGEQPGDEDMPDGSTSCHDLSTGHIATFTPHAHHRSRCGV